jgi:hypothetical protein
MWRTLHEGLTLATQAPEQLAEWNGWMDVAAYLAVVLAALSLVRPP